MQKDQGETTQETKDFIEDLKESELSPYCYSDIFGVSCVAVTTNDHELVNHMFWDKYGRAHYDNMGLDYVVYWPKYKAKMEDF